MCQQCYDDTVIGRVVAILRPQDDGLVVTVKYMIGFDKQDVLQDVFVYGKRLAVGDAVDIVLGEDGYVRTVTKRVVTDKKGCTFENARPAGPFKMCNRGFDPTDELKDPYSTRQCAKCPAAAKLA